MKSYVLLGLAVIALLISAAQAAQISEMRASLAGDAVAGGGNGGSQGGAETYDDMMARMHPDQVAQKSAPAAASAPAMVGGC